MTGHETRGLTERERTAIWLGRLALILAYIAATRWCARDGMTEGEFRCSCWSARTRSWSCCWPAGWRAVTGVTRRLVFPHCARALCGWPASWVISCGAEEVGPGWIGAVNSCRIHRRGWERQLNRPGRAVKLR